MLFVQMILCILGYITVLCYSAILKCNVKVLCYSMTPRSTYICLPVHEEGMFTLFLNYKITNKYLGAIQIII